MANGKRKLVSDKTKMEIAKEMGIESKISDGGWANISAHETGSMVKRMIEKGMDKL